jgi:hypothetical protein
MTILTWSPMTKVLVAAMMVTRFLLTIPSRALPRRGWEAIIFLFFSLPNLADDITVPLNILQAYVKLVMFTKPSLDLLHTCKEASALFYICHGFIDKA